MTKIAVLSDIHGNIAALDLAIRDAEKKGAEKIICLGDLVAKYFYPAEVVDALRSQSEIVVQGNCDDLVATNTNYKFARSKLGLGRIEYLANLPIREQLLISGSLINFFHATPASLDDMYNIFYDNSRSAYREKRVTDIGKMFVNPENVSDLSGRRISFCGHTHQDFMCVSEPEGATIVAGTKFIIRPQMDVVVNVGSVGDSSRIVITEDGAKSLLNKDLTYVMIEGELNSASVTDIKVEIIKVPYQETLKCVYTDMLEMQTQGTVSAQPADMKRIEESLLEMGEPGVPSSEDALRRVR